MSQQDAFQPVSTFDLKPVYISLGLPKTTFGAGEAAPSKGPFGAALDGGTQYPDCVWLFRGEDCYRFNVATGEFEAGPDRISSMWGGASWPLLFASGIDCAVWGGPAYPDLVYFYKDNLYVRYRVSSGQVDVPPSPIQKDWGSARGNWLAGGPGAALHTIETRYQGMIHFFKGAEYIRHNLNNGARDAGPMPIAEQWQLPELFAQGIDLAFYGAGDESQKIYFFKGDQYVAYDLRTGRAEGPSAIEDRFPAMARFIDHPQLFLVENYQLNTYVGPTEAGEVVETISVIPHEKKSVILVTEVTESSSTAIHQTLLQSQDNTVENNFYQQMKSQNEQSGSHETYDYHLDASFHGDASANSLWGGEVNANLKAQGGTNDVRNSFTQAAFGTIESQIKTTSKQLQQQVYSSDQQITRTDHIVKRQEQTLDNTNVDTLRVYEFRQQRQLYLTLLTLRGIQFAFANSRRAPETVDISRLDALLAKYVPKQEDRDQVSQLIIGELTTINDYQGTPKSALKEVSPPAIPNGLPGRTLYQFDPQLKANYSITNPDGSEQVIVINGIVKGDRLWRTPTYTIIAQEKS